MPFVSFDNNSSFQKKLQQELLTLESNHCKSIVSLVMEFLTIRYKEKERGSIKIVGIISCGAKNEPNTCSIYH